MPEVHNGNSEGKGHMQVFQATADHTPSLGKDDQHSIHLYYPNKYVIFSHVCVPTVCVLLKMCIYLAFCSVHKCGALLPRCMSEASIVSTVNIVGALLKEVAAWHAFI